jgi:hypothetical protein
LVSDACSSKSKLTLSKCCRFSNLPDIFVAI